MNILMDVNPLYTDELTGIGVFTNSLANELDRLSNLNGYAFNWKGDRLLKKQFTIIEQKILPGKTLTYPRYLGLDIPLWFFFDISRQDVVLGSNYLIPPSGGVTSVPVVHDLGFIDHPEWTQSRNSHILSKMLPKTLARSSGVITISDFTASRIREVYKYDKPILVISIPPDKPADNLSNPKTENIISGKFFLFVGTIEPRKNLATLLDSYLSLPAVIKGEYSLVLAGKAGWDKDTLARLNSGTLDGVHYLGYVSRPERAWLYSNCIATIIPSHYEGFGMMTLESISYGAPTIVSDIPPQREILGDTGLYFDSGSKEQLASCMTSLLDTTSRAKLLREQRPILDKYSWQKTAKQVMEFLEVLQ